MARQQEALILLAAALLAGQAHAIEVQTLDVRYANGRYIVDFRALLDAPPGAVGAVLTDYESYPELDPRIRESKRLPADGTHPPRLVTRLRGCLGGFLCRSLRRVETLHERNFGRSGELRATADPEQSDVSFGETRSAWEPHADGTAVTYHLELTPDFWVPPLFGRRAMIRTLREGTLSLFTNVERVARERSESTPE